MAAAKTGVIKPHIETKTKNEKQLRVFCFSVPGPGGQRLVAINTPCVGVLSRGPAPGKSREPPADRQAKRRRSTDRHSDQPPAALRKPCQENFHKPERSHAGNRTGGRRFNRLRVQGGVTYGYGYGLVLWDGLSWWLTYLRSARRAPGHQASSSPKMSLGGDPFPTSLSPA